MALDVYKLDTNEYLFGLDNSTFENLLIIFEKFEQYTGLKITLYTDLRLSIENLKTLVKIIDRYIEETDLNKNKKRISCIIEFKGLLNYFLSNNISLLLKGD